MLPLKIYTRKKIFNYYTGLSFFVFIWISRLTEDEVRLIRHEKIHFHQQIEMLFIFHWLFYVFFYLVSRVRGHSHYAAYRFNPFELEAFTHDFDAAYLQRRRPYAWIRFIKKYYRLLDENHSNIVKKASSEIPVFDVPDIKE